MVGGTLKQKLDQLVDLTIRIAKLEPWKYLSEYDLIEVFSQNNEMVYGKDNIYLNQTMKEKGIIGDD